MNKLRCPYANCGWLWTPRVQEPICCPKCQQRFAWAAKNPTWVTAGQGKGETP